MGVSRESEAQIFFAHKLDFKDLVPKQPQNFWVFCALIYNPATLPSIAEDTQEMKGGGGGGRRVSYF